MGADITAQERTHVVKAAALLFAAGDNPQLAVSMLRVVGLTTPNEIEHVRALARGVRSDRDFSSTLGQAVEVLKIIRVGNETEQLRSVIEQTEGIVQAAKMFSEAPDQIAGRFQG